MSRCITHTHTHTRARTHTHTHTHHAIQSCRTQTNAHIAHHAAHDEARDRGLINTHAGAPARWWDRCLWTPLKQCRQTRLVGAAEWLSVNIHVTMTLWSARPRRLFAAPQGVDLWHAMLTSTWRVPSIAECSKTSLARRSEGTWCRLWCTLAVACRRQWTTKKSAS
jgi:hypothetical protein